MEPNVLRDPVRVINIGLASFAEDLRARRRAGDRARLAAAGGRQRAAVGAAGGHGRRGLTGLP